MQHDIPENEALWKVLGNVWVTCATAFVIVLALALVAYRLASY